MAQSVAHAHGQERRAIVLALPAPHEDLLAPEIDVLDAEREALHETQAAAIEDLGDQAVRRREALEHGQHVGVGEHRRQVLRAARPLETGEVAHLPLEDAFVEEDDRAERLVLGGSRGPTPHREVVQKGGDVLGRHLARVLAAVEADELADSVEVGLLGPSGTVESSHRAAYGFEERHEGSLCFRGPLERPGGEGSIERSSGGVAWSVSIFVGVDGWVAQRASAPQGDEERPARDQGERRGRTRRANRGLRSQRPNRGLRSPLHNDTGALLRSDAGPAFAS
jgi:hypothetical protein